jgi:hypothetical protein
VSGTTKNEKKFQKLKYLSVDLFAWSWSLVASFLAWPTGSDSEGFFLAIALTVVQ